MAFRGRGGRGRVPDNVLESDAELPSLVSDLGFQGEASVGVRAVGQVTRDLANDGDAVLLQRGVVERCIRVTDVGQRVHIEHHVDDLCGADGCHIRAVHFYESEFDPPFSPAVALAVQLVFKRHASHFHAVANTLVMLYALGDGRGNVDRIRSFTVAIDLGDLKRFVARWVGQNELVVFLFNVLVLLQAADFCSKLGNLAGWAECLAIANADRLSRVAGTEYSAERGFVSKNAAVAAAESTSVTHGYASRCVVHVNEGIVVLVERPKIVSILGKLQVILLCNFLNIG